VSKWSDDVFLDGLRQSGDPLADAAVARLEDEGGAKAVGMAFRHLQGNDSPLPPDAPAALHDFIAASGGLPDGVRPDRLEAGAAAFLDNALPSVVVLLAASLPRGYAAPCLTHILSISRDLERHPYERLMGVVQLLVNISANDAFDPRGPMGSNHASSAGIDSSPAARRCAIPDHAAAKDTPIATDTIHRDRAVAERAAESAATAVGINARDCAV